MSVRTRPWVVVTAVVALVSATVAVTMAVAGTTIHKASGGKVTKVIARGSTEAFDHGVGTNFIPLPGARAKVTVPAGKRALVTARFSAETSCSNGTTGVSGHCAIRIMFGNKQGLPATGADYAFDSSDQGAEDYFSWEGHSMERFRTLGPGTHTIKVQTKTHNDPPLTFHIDDWTLIVERAIK